MKSVLIMLGLLFGVAARAQQFQTAMTTPLDPTESPLQVAWADVDNDSVPDVILSVKIQNHIALVAYTHLAQGASLRKMLFTTGFETGTFEFTDFNNDNRIDIAFSGVDTVYKTRTEIYLNQGSFVFQQGKELLPVASFNFVFSDLNNDAKKDIAVIQSLGALTAYKAGQNFTVLFDSVNLNARGLAVADFDGNGFNDIAFSAENQLHQPVLTVIEFRNAFDTLRTLHLPLPVKGQLATGDLNHDGLFDLIATGQNGVSEWITRRYINRDTTFIVDRSSPGLDNAALKVADFDSDGMADVSFRGTDVLARNLNWIKTASGDSVLLPAAHILSQAFGDYDRDGDLDVAQLLDTPAILIMENKAIRNNRPAPPSNPLGAFVYDRLFLYWQKPHDDHTPLPALTYDLALLAGSTEVYASEFDRQSLQRLTVTHGNRGTNNFALLNVPVANYSFEVQSVDNSFVGSYRCTGSGVQGCTQLETHTLTACSDAPIDLSGTPASLWFSFEDGYLGTNDSMLVKSKTDTVFSFTPQTGSSCGLIKVYLINKEPNAAPTILNQNLAVCEGTTAVVFTDEEWEEVVWSDGGYNQIGVGDTLRYPVLRDGILIATGRTNNGCTLKQTVSIRASKPLLKVNGDDFKIMKGQSVNLEATGASTYLWQPPQGLSNSTAADPVASPMTTTTYTVTGFDSLNCSAQARVLIEVEQTAFVPNLFTPNGDGKNDELRIYGLYQAKEFYFAIHNREGSIVYESKDLSNVISQGWDGAHRGTLQPPGLYYWKIEGSYDDGSRLYLNGKTKGSILLVR